MTTFFARLRKVFQAEAHTALSEFEDPIGFTKQGIRYLKRNLSEGTVSLAQAKSVALRMRQEAETERRRAADFEHKAVALIERGRSRELLGAKADRLAVEALRLKGDADTRHLTLSQYAEQQEELAAQLENRIEALKHEVSRYEDELVTLQALTQTVHSAKTISQRLTEDDPGTVTTLLAHMREKVADEEVLAEAYARLSEAPESIEREIDEALSDQTANLHIYDTFAELKARLGNGANGA